LNNPWPITAELLSGELDLLHAIVERWRARFADEAWLQELDASPDADRDQVFHQFTNEMKVVASKSATLVEVIQ
jgi:uncharacterized protein YpiB (UPF0302 family)